MRNLCLLVVICLNFAIVCSAQAEQTRLRASSPKGTFETYRGATRLTKVVVNVKNVGEETAKKVNVQVRLPNGNSVELHGPSDINAKSEASFTGYPGDYVVSSKKLKADVSCANCYK